MIPGGFFVGQKVWDLKPNAKYADNPPDDWEDCGQCGCTHPPGFTGDCRDDINRWPSNECVAALTGGGVMATEEWRAKIQSELSHFNASGQFFRHPLNPNVVYTEGVQYMAEQCGAYWLVDAIASCNQHVAEGKAEKCQVWILRREPFNNWKLTCGDGNGNIVYAGRSDFPTFHWMKLSCGSRTTRCTCPRSDKKGSKMSFIKRLCGIKEKMDAAKQEYNEEAAEREGWALFEADGEMQIQKIDWPESLEFSVADTFRDDGQAWQHVVQRAREGSKLHRAALSLVSDKEREAIKDYCGGWK